MNPADLDAVRVHKLEQVGAQTRHVAEVLAQFRTQLIEEGFTEEGAEALANTMILMWLHE